MSVTPSLPQSGRQPKGSIPLTPKVFQKFSLDKKNLVFPSFSLTF